MDLETVWTIASKDLGIFRRKKSIFYATIILPLAISIALPGVIAYIASKSSTSTIALTGLLDSFSLLFVIIAAVIPTAISSYSIVGEKVENSLEPLLATPATDDEILLGKSLASFIPAILAVFLGATIFMILTDAVTNGKLGYLYYPNWTMALVLLVVAPLYAVFAVEANVLISARVNDVRTATQLGGLTILPLMAIYLLSEIKLISVDANSLFIIAAIILVADVVLFYLSRATFRREEILTRWK
ncbi:MAG TPA: ABC transporter permease subunit [Methanomassiliicoccales archaeon]|jgi:ABC-type Na+ efflux pump permease subunit